jgi:hypothetical protein
MLLSSFKDGGHDMLSKFVLSRMKQDDISSIARHDDLIVSLGNTVIVKTGSKKANYVSQRMRQLARLLKELNKSNTSKPSLMDYIDTTCFDDIVKTVKSLCGLDDESTFIWSP